MADTRVRVIYQFETKRYHAEVTCKACGWKVIFPGAGMAWLFNPGVGLDQAKARMRCRRCGARGAEILPVRTGRW